MADVSVTGPHTHFSLSARLIPVAKRGNAHLLIPKQKKIGKFSPMFFKPTLLSRPNSMESWLKLSGAVGLDGLDLAHFPATGRGVQTLRRFKEGEEILTIPHGILWTVGHAYADPLLGPALRSAQPPLSVEDTLATYILFIRSRESGYDGLRSHVAALPTSYSSSIFFAEDELEVCAGSSLYTITKQLGRSIEDDYKALVVRVLVQYRDLFPLDKFTIEDVSNIHV